MRTKYAADAAEKLWDMVKNGSARSDAAIRYALGVEEHTLEQWVETKPAFRAAYLAAMESTRVRILEGLEAGTINPAAAKILLGGAGFMTVTEKRVMELKERELAIRTGLTDGEGAKLEIVLAPSSVPARTIDPDTGFVIDAEVVDV